MVTPSLTSTPSKILIDHIKQNEKDAFLSHELDFPAIRKGNVTPELMKGHAATTGDKLVDGKNRAVDLCMLESDVEQRPIGLSMGDVAFPFIGVSVPSAPLYCIPASDPH